MKFREAVRFGTEKSGSGMTLKIGICTRLICAVARA